MPSRGTLTALRGGSCKTHDVQESVVEGPSPLSGAQSRNTGLSEKGLRAAMKIKTQELLVMENL